MKGVLSVLTFRFRIFPQVFPQGYFFTSIFFLLPLTGPIEAEQPPGVAGLPLTSPGS